MAELGKSGRGSDGRFAPGNRINVVGKAPGTRNRTTLAMEALLEGQQEALTQKAIEMALNGDGQALRLCLDRIAPPRKDSPITFAMAPVRSAADALQASSALLSAVAAGEVTPHEGGRVMALLAAHKSIVETGDLEARVAALENKRRRHEHDPKDHAS